jgi:hypothetical protein
MTRQLGSCIHLQDDIGRKRVAEWCLESFMVGLLFADALILSIRRVTAAAVLFAAFGACGLSRSNKISRGFLLAAASVCSVFAALCLETMVLQSIYWLSPWWQEETLLAALGITAATLLAWPWRHRTRAAKAHD